MSNYYKIPVPPRLDTRLLKTISLAEGPKRLGLWFVNCNHPETPQAPKLKWLKFPIRTTSYARPLPPPKGQFFRTISHDSNKRFRQMDGLIHLLYTSNDSSGIKSSCLYSHWIACLKQ